MAAMTKQTNPIDQKVLYSWGANSCGQLGSGTTEDCLHPCRVVARSVPVDEEVCVGGGGAFSFLLTGSGQLFMCGRNDRGQQGTGDISHTLTFAPCLHPALKLKVSQVAAGWNFVLALTDTGCLLSWGSNAFGQLGRSTTDVKNVDPVPAQVKFPDISDKVTQMDAGLRHSVAVTECGRVYTWGHGRRGQLGTLVDGHVPQNSMNPMKVAIESDDQVTTAVAGMYHTAILTSDGNMSIWGCNKYGQCCVDPETTKNVTTPHKAKLCDNVFNDRITGLTTGWTHLLAITSSGNVYSWGRADLGQLGRSSNTPYDHIPGPIGLTGIRKLICGSEHNLALSENGDIYSWGWNEHGICGTGDEQNVPVPHKVKAFDSKTAADIGAGPGHSFCHVWEKTTGVS